MQNERFFDQAQAMIEQGHVSVAVPMIAGKLYAAQANSETWQRTRQSLHQHPLHAMLLEDPYVAHCFRKPRGYAGDAKLIDYIYDQVPPTPVSERGKTMFLTTTAFQASEGVRLRRDHAEQVVGAAHDAGKSICVLACGHFREGDQLIGKDLSQVTLVDQDELSLELVRLNHGYSANIVEANVLKYLRGVARSGECFDLIYTLGLTDYLDDRAMRLLHKLMKACLNPGGTMLLANFVPDHLAVGWMDAVMDWQLIYRDEADLARYAGEIGMKAKTWRDPSGSIAWCEMMD